LRYDDHVAFDRPAASAWTPRQELDLEVLHARRDHLHVDRALLPAAPGAVALASHR
jgi:hypothetical protein